MCHSREAGNVYPSHVNIYPKICVPSPTVSENVSSAPSCHVSNPDPVVVRQLPCSEGGRSIDVFQSCIDDKCVCSHFIGESLSQLRPCRIGNFLFSGQCTLPSEDVMSIWNGIFDGFKIVDDVAIPSYECQNYKSILDKKFVGEMSSMLTWRRAG